MYTTTCTADAPHKQNFKKCDRCVIVDVISLLGDIYLVYLEGASSVNAL